MPKVSENNEFKKTLLDALREREKKLRNLKPVTPENIRVHAILGCLKRAYWDICLEQSDMPYSTKAIGYYVVGRSHHDMIECIKGYLREVGVNRWGIHGTIDMLGDYPVEIKSSRVKPLAFGGINPWYLKQLGYYCALVGKNVGILIVFYIIDPEFFVYTIEFSNDEIEAYTIEMINKAERLREALRTGNISVLEGTNMDWECEGCDYVYFCRKNQKA